MVNIAMQYGYFQDPAGPSDSLAESGHGRPAEA